MSAVAASQLTFSAGRSVMLDDVSLAFAPGALVGLIGPNGAGKSTLLRLLAGYLRPNAGTVAWQGRDLRRWREAERGAYSGYMPQHGAPAWDYSVGEIVALGASRVGGRPISLDATLDAFDLANLADRRWSALSGGERARAMLASVMATRPALLFADEPGASLDVRHRLDLMARLRASARDSVVIVALHDLDLACRFCDRLILLDTGRVAADGEARAIGESDALERVFGIRFQRERLQPGADALIGLTNSPTP